MSRYLQSRRCALADVLRVRSRGAPCRAGSHRCVTRPLGRSDGDLKRVRASITALRKPPVPRTARHLWGALTSISLLASGCAPQQPFYFFEDGDLSHYVGAIQKLEYPDSCEAPLDEASGTTEPLTLSNARFDQIWELSLEEAIRTALENGKVLRNLGGRFQSFGGPRPQTGEPAVSLLTNPQVTPSIYDPAIAETDPFRGVESALSLFDAQVSSSLTWDRINRPQNFQPSVNIIFPQNLQGDTGNWTTGIQKKTATGATFGVSNSTLYDNVDDELRLHVQPAALAGGRRHLQPDRRARSVRQHLRPPTVSRRLARPYQRRHLAG